jgi:hypothetical protein
MKQMLRANKGMIVFMSYTNRIFNNGSQVRRKTVLNILCLRFLVRSGIQNHTDIFQAYSCTGQNRKSQRAWIRKKAYQQVLRANVWQTVLAGFLLGNTEGLFGVGCEFLKWGHNFFLGSFQLIIQE